MAMEKAVVAPAMENIRDIIEDRVTGLLFEAGDAGALRTALRTVVRDEALRQRLGRSARERIVARFNWRHNAQAIIDEASRLAAGATNGSRPHAR
jgi:phosphatidylinositol alpha 1,6-mannosyltransferase